MGGEQRAVGGGLWAERRAQRAESDKGAVVTLCSQPSALCLLRLGNDELTVVGPADGDDSVGVQLSRDAIGEYQAPVDRTADLHAARVEQVRMRGLAGDRPVEHRDGLEDVREGAGRIHRDLRAGRELQGARLAVRRSFNRSVEDQATLDREEAILTPGREGHRREVHDRVEGTRCLDRLCRGR